MACVRVLRDAALQGSLSDGQAVNAARVRLSSGWCCAWHTLFHPWPELSQRVLYSTHMVLQGRSCAAEHTCGTAHSKRSPLCSPGHRMAPSGRIAALRQH
jgi:hypothetical protein